MNRRIPILLGAAPVAVLIALAGCQSRDREEAAATPAAETVATTPEVLPPVGLGVFADTSAALSPVVYADGSRTLNDACPVRKGKLSRSRIPMFVNGHPVGFC